MVDNAAGAHGGRPQQEAQGARSDFFTRQSRRRHLPCSRYLLSFINSVVQRQRRATQAAASARAPRGLSPSPQSGQRTTPAVAAASRCALVPRLAQSRESASLSVPHRCERSLAVKVCAQREMEQERVCNRIVRGNFASQQQRRAGFMMTTSRAWAARPSANAHTARNHVSHTSKGHQRGGAAQTRATAPPTQRNKQTQQTRNREQTRRHTDLAFGKQGQRGFARGHRRHCALDLCASTNKG